MSNTFQNLKDVMSCKHATISLTWIAFELDINIVGVNLLAFQCGDKQYHAMHPKLVTCKPCKFLKKKINTIVDNIELVCIGITSITCTYLS